MDREDAVAAIVYELQRIGDKLDEVTEKLDSELNWANKLSFAREVLDRLDQIDVHVQFSGQ